MSFKYPSEYWVECLVVLSQKRIQTQNVSGMCHTSYIWYPFVCTLYSWYRFQLPIFKKPLSTIPCDWCVHYEWVRSITMTIFWILNLICFFFSFHFISFCMNCMKCVVFYNVCSSFSTSTNLFSRTKPIIINYCWIRMCVCVWKLIFWILFIYIIKMQEDSGVEYAYALEVLTVY